MLLRKLIETKQQPSTAKSDPQISCCFYYPSFPVWHSAHEHGTLGTSNRLRKCNFGQPNSETLFKRTNSRGVWVWFPFLSVSVSWHGSISQCARAGGRGRGRQRSLPPSLLPSRRPNSSPSLDATQAKKEESTLGLRRPPSPDWIQCSVAKKVSERTPLSPLWGNSESKIVSLSLKTFVDHVSD